VVMAGWEDGGRGRSRLGQSSYGLEKSRLPLLQVPAVLWWGKTLKALGLFPAMRSR